MRAMRLIGYALAGALVPGTGVLGQHWQESQSGGLNGNPDSGRTLGTANVTDGAGALTTIEGRLNGGAPWDVDMFQIRITDPASFSANTFAGDANFSLFDANGVAIAFSDNHSPGVPYPRLTSAFTSGLAPGIFYLAISQNHVDLFSNNVGYTRPLDVSGNLLFPGAAQLSSQMSFERVGEWGPSTPGSVLADWEMKPSDPSLFFFDSGSTYTIELTGASYAIPSPGAAPLVLAAGLAACRRRRRSL